MSTITRKEISNCHFFRINYSNGKEKWVAFDGPDDTDMGVAEMKKMIEKSETKGNSRHLATVWYMGQLTLWKA